MGVTGLLKCFKWICIMTALDKLPFVNGQRRILIDASVLIHQLICLDFCAKALYYKDFKVIAKAYVYRMDQLLNHQCTPITVFDGDRNPFKKLTDENRKKQATKAVDELVSTIASDLIPSDQQYIAAARHIPLELILCIMKELKRRDFQFYRSFREADSQLKLMDELDLGDYVLTNDVDLLVLGCRRVLITRGWKKKITFELYYYADLFTNPKSNPPTPLSSFLSSLSPALRHIGLIRLAVLAGCDYTKFTNIGLTTAIQILIESGPTLDTETIITSITRHSTTYTKERAKKILEYGERAFQDGLAYHPILKTIVTLSKRPTAQLESDFQFVLLSPSLTEQIATGVVHPESKSVINFDNLNFEKTKEYEFIKYKFQPSNPYLTLDLLKHCPRWTHETFDEKTATMPQLVNYLSHHAMVTSGTKLELIKRVKALLMTEAHPTYGPPKLRDPNHRSARELAVLTGALLVTGRELRANDLIDATDPHDWIVKLSEVKKRIPHLYLSTIQEYFKPRLSVDNTGRVLSEGKLRSKHMKELRGLAYYLNPDPHAQHQCIIILLVPPKQKSEEEPYHVVILFEIQDMQVTKIKRGFCTCPANADGLCVHISQVLFTVLKLIEDRENPALADVACTSTANRWLRPNSSAQPIDVSIPMHAVSFKYKDHGVNSHQHSFDPLPDCIVDVSKLQQLHLAVSRDLQHPSMHETLHK